MFRLRFLAHSNAPGRLGITGVAWLLLAGRRHPPPADMNSCGMGRHHTVFIWCDARILARVFPALLLFFYSICLCLRTFFCCAVATGAASAWAPGELDVGGRDRAAGRTAKRPPACLYAGPRMALRSLIGYVCLRKRCAAGSRRFHARGLKNTSPAHDGWAVGYTHRTS
jgi:hypothetical protein